MSAQSMGRRLDRLGSAGKGSAAFIEVLEAAQVDGNAVQGAGRLYSILNCALVKVSPAQA